jgi:prepilin-type N-terminal cleavage/methylation domain-containing protein
MRSRRPLRIGPGRRRHARGFTLFETIFVIAVLALVSAGILGMQPQVWQTQSTARDQLVGFELTLACAEKLLAQRRTIGYAFISNTACAGMGGLGGYAADPVVTLSDANGNSVTSCATATCTASIIIAKTTTPPATLTPITLQLSAY